MTLEKALSISARFPDEFVEVCRFLQRWIKEEKLLLNSGLNELPRTNWRVMAQALFFIGAASPRLLPLTAGRSFATPNMRLSK